MLPLCLECILHLNKSEISKDDSERVIKELWHFWVSRAIIIFPSVTPGGQVCFCQFGIIQSVTITEKRPFVVVQAQLWNEVSLFNGLANSRHLTIWPNIILATCQRSKMKWQSKKYCKPASFILTIKLLNHPLRVSEIWTKNVYKMYAKVWGLHYSAIIPSSQIKLYSLRWLSFQTSKYLDWLRQFFNYLMQ